MKKLARRAFLKATAAVAGAIGLTSLGGCGGGGSSGEEGPGAALLPRRAFGNTGVDVGIFGLGGQAALEQAGQEAASEAIIARALDLGVNYVDTSAAYGGGLSERNIGRTLGSRRSDVFLATKTLFRSYDGAMRDLERSLTNLQTDSIDLWQLHNLQAQVDFDRMGASDGALRALEQAQSEGTVRFVGVSGHYDPDVLTSAITSYDFDAVLMALNAADVHYQSFATNTLPAATGRNMGVVAMKVPARGRMFQDPGITTMHDALGYVLSYPVSTAIIGCSTVAEVEENAAIARAFEPLPAAEMRRLEGLTAPYHRDATWFKA